MDVPTALLHGLARVTDSIGSDHAGLAARLVALAGGFRAAVPSARGLHVTIGVEGHPVGLSFFLPAEDHESITTSLRLPLEALGPRFDRESRVVFYAATPGALVDLAADLAYALRLAVSQPFEPDGGHSGVGDRDDAGRAADHAVALDADLPPSTLTSEMVGLAELSTINQAIGLLIEQGQPPDHVQVTLADGAAREGVPVHLYAARLLQGGEGW